MLTFVEAISEKSLRSTVALTAARGRVSVYRACSQPHTHLTHSRPRVHDSLQGKSAALGLSIAAAVAYGYSNIFVTSPSPENLHTLFEFVFKGLQALAYTEHMDYEAVQSTHAAMGGAVVRVNVFRTHRQTIQYIDPKDAATRLGQAELLVIDEAAAIPLPVVKAMLGPHLVFMASTVNGYEGTGRALSLKLVKQLRQQQDAAAVATARSSGGGMGWWKDRSKKARLAEKHARRAARSGGRGGGGGSSSSGSGGAGGGAGAATGGPSVGAGTGAIGRVLREVGVGW